MTAGQISIYCLGLLAQALFSARILVQWIKSEKAGKVVSPTLFWVLSLVASLLFFIYGWLREDFSLMLGQFIGYYVYIWNLSAKGVWKPMGNPGKVLAAVLLLLPGVAAVSICGNPEAFSTLFRNEGIPLWLLIFGSAGQIIFSLRFLYQFIYSSRRGESVLPFGFWIISTTGALLILTYGIIRLDPVVILAQSFGLCSYIRNLTIWKKEHRAKES
ncbi:MAG: lipid-A-disaccharide synthase N-terminal domain-containing protein [Bacteroidales bacterium]|nr:lipid-A-disaccharide synthase N-terminal domain-containing protein [Candidatus Cacconaster caballi]